MTGRVLNAKGPFRLLAGTSVGARCERRSLFPIISTINSPTLLNFAHARILACQRIEAHRLPVFTYYERPLRSTDSRAVEAADKDQSRELHVDGDHGFPAVTAVSPR